MVIVHLSIADSDVIFKDDNFKTTVFKDGKLQLLLKLLGAERIGLKGIRLMTFI